MKRITALFKWLAVKAVWLLKSITIILRLIWYLFPSFFFLFAAYSCFWSLSQGKDVLISVLEKKGANWIILLSLIFWVLVTWYTSRVLIYLKPELNKASKAIAFHGPRMLGFFGFSIVWLSLLQLPELPNQHFSYPISSTAASLSLWLGTPILYGILYWFFKKCRVVFFWRQGRSAAPGISAEDLEKARMKAYSKVFWILRILLALVFLINIFFNNATLLLFSIIFLQLMYLFAIIWRRGALLFEKMPARFDNIKSWAVTEDIDWPNLNWLQKTYYGILYYGNISKKERAFFGFFNLVTAIAVYYYLRAIFVMSFANKTGTMPFILLAFGVLAGFFALVSAISIITKINFHIFLFTLVILLGLKREPHYIRRFSEKTTPLLAARPTLKNYFLRWAEQRKDSIRANSNYPIFFVLSDGGASRSGYWTAAVLGRMEDQTRGQFSQHLFCLSGTSGGGVGVGIFFALLHDKKEMTGYSYELRAKEYLKNDFLTYTLTRMLGPDFFRPLMPLYMKSVTDRAGALEKTMEEGMDDSVFLKHRLANPFSVFIEDTTQPLSLPVLCINTTRIQDGRPGVITNINLAANKAIFSNRVDVIKLLNKEDIHLSTAVVMGARFPYISPAGRIDEHFIKKDTSKGPQDSIKAHYFVDGGYFDNSGAGVVNEMIIEMRRLTDSLTAGNDSSYTYLKNLSFYIVHATNSPTGDAIIEKVHPIKNDLAAPVLTIVGAYGTQTDINNSRLKRYLQGIYKDNKDNHYQTVDLYYHINHDTLSFPMNWTISEFYRKRMDMQLDTSKQVFTFLNWLKTAVK
ncbi:MAG: patatin-like phospholipase family protein [Chitinophagaceae bacterium]